MRTTLLYLLTIVSVNWLFAHTPDIIDGTEEQNRKLVEGWPLSRAVPVWHMHESIGFLKEICSLFSFQNRLF